METKGDLYRCTKCLIFQPKENFHAKKNKLGIRSICKTCRSSERSQRYVKNKKQELEYGRIYKINNPEKRKGTQQKSAAKNLTWFRSFLNVHKSVLCLDCEKVYPPCAMDFDHRDPLTKISNVSEMQSSSEKDILLEISKCDIICANCHRIREYNRRTNKKPSYISTILMAYKNTSCVDCGVQYPWYVMDFDHLNPKNKLFNISKPPKTDGSVKQLIATEITKCEVVCANCHRIRTFIGKIAV